MRVFSLHWSVSALSCMKTTHLGYVYIFPAAECTNTPVQTEDSHTDDAPVQSQVTLSLDDNTREADQTKQTESHRQTSSADTSFHHTQTTSETRDSEISQTSNIDTVETVSPPTFSSAQMQTEPLAELPPLQKVTDPRPSTDWGKQGPDKETSDTSNEDEITNQATPIDKEVGQDEAVSSKTLTTEIRRETETEDHTAARDSGSTTCTIAAVPDQSKEMREETTRIGFGIDENTEHSEDVAETQEEVHAHDSRGPRGGDKDDGTTQKHPRLDRRTSAVNFQDGHCQTDEIVTEDKSGQTKENTNQENQTDRIETENKASAVSEWSSTDTQTDTTTTEHQETQHPTLDSLTIEDAHSTTPNFEEQVRNDKDGESSKEPKTITLEGYCQTEAISVQDMDSQTEVDEGSQETSVVEDSCQTETQSGEESTSAQTETVPGSDKDSQTDPIVNENVSLEPTSGFRAPPAEITSMEMECQTDLTEAMLLALVQKSSTIVTWDPSTPESGMIISATPDESSAIPKNTQMDDSDKDLQTDPAVNENVSLEPTSGLQALPAEINSVEMKCHTDLTEAMLLALDSSTIVTPHRSATEFGMISATRDESSVLRENTPGDDMVDQAASSSEKQLRLHDLGKASVAEVSAGKRKDPKQISTFSSTGENTLEERERVLDLPLDSLEGDIHFPDFLDVPGAANATENLSFDVDAAKDNGEGSLPDLVVPDDRNLPGIAETQDRTTKDQGEGRVAGIGTGMKTEASEAESTAKLLQGASPAASEASGSFVSGAPSSVSGFPESVVKAECGGSSPTDDSSVPTQRTETTSVVLRRRKQRAPLILKYAEVEKAGVFCTYFCRCCLPCYVLFLLLLAIACILSLFEPDIRCCFENHYPSTFGVMMTYPNGAPPS